MKSFNIAEIDCIFISYDEPNAELNYADLLTKAPWAKRIHGVKGSDAAHKAAAEISETERFVTVDADNIVDFNFFNLTLEENNNQYSWCGKNNINGLVYGNGGLKCWTRNYVKNMRTHESAEKAQNQVDFCWDKNYQQMANCFSVTNINASPLQAWRAGFREGVKMTLKNGLKVDLTNPKKQLNSRNYKRLLIWSSVGSDVDQGLWAIYGARLGCYLTNCTDWNHLEVRDFDSLKTMFEAISYQEPLEQIDYYGKLLKEKLRLPLAFLYPEQSLFFKSVWTNPPRFDNMVRELDTNWDD